MRFQRILSDFRPAFKFGPAVPVGAVLGAAGISAGGSILSGIIGSESSGSNVAAQLAAQRELAHEQMDWQTEEAEKARSFDASQAELGRAFLNEQRLASQDYQTEQWQRQFDQELASRSPVYQSQQLRQANLNPAVYFGQQASFSGTSSPGVSAPSGSGSPIASSPMPSSVSGISPVQFQPLDLQLGRVFGDVAQGIKSLSEARKTGIESDYLVDTFVDRVREQMNKSNLSGVMTELAQLDKSLKSQTLPYQVKMAIKEVEKAAADIDFTKTSTIKEQSATALNNALERLNGAITQNYDLLNEKLGMEMPYVIKYIQSQIKSNVASASESYAKAAESKANAATTNALRTYEVKIKDYISQQEHNKADISNSTITDQLNAAIAEAEKKYNLSKADAEEARRRAAALRDINDARNYSAVSRVIDDTFTYIGEHISAAIGLSKLSQ